MALYYNCVCLVVRKSCHSAIILPRGKIHLPERGWRNWYTRTPKERMEQSMQVQVLSRALGGFIAQLVRAFGLHPKGRRSESYWIHKFVIISKFAEIRGVLSHQKLEFLPR